MSTTSTRSPEEQVRHLFNAHGPALLGYLRRLSRDYHTGEDLMQETMLRAFRYADRLWTSEAAQRGWLFRVGHNVAVTNFAKADLVVELGDENASSAADPASDVIAQVDVVRNLKQLSPTQRRVFYELFYLDRSVAEAASALQVSPSTVRTHLDVGLRRLRRNLVDDGPAPTSRGQVARR